MQTRRLTDHFTPEHYQISLDIDRLGRTFSGVITIRGTMAADGSIWLHAKELAIRQCHIDGSAVSWEASDNDELELKADSLSGTAHTITITYDGTISDQMHGMYPCYFEHDGTKKELIATQFESHHAREVFPGIDEPLAKARFDVTLTTEPGITVIGNMPITDQRTENDRLVTSFETTPRMSSYLLAWVYGELHKKSAQTAGGVEVNVWATPAQPAASLDFALDIAVRTIDFFDDYFGTPYPLSKSDHVALPDFSSGAMENWGLITYREMALLADPQSTSVSAKHYIATVVAHELAHQWFGNLVTMKWWNDLWLNESFATLMEYIAIDALEPDWNVWLDFASAETVMALRRDALDGVQAVQVDVNHPDEISTLFDSAIVYAKGARLLRMLETYVGKDAFRSGLKDYFKLHAYKNTEASDLWSALSKSSGKDIAGFMNAWISQPGYPVVEFSDDSITQSQFFVGAHADEPIRLWPIPLGADDAGVPELLETPSIDMTATANTRLNVSDSAHFITNYSQTRLAAILEDISSLPPLARLQLMHEQSLLARSGQLPSSRLIPLLQSYQLEKEESVWDIMALVFGELKRFVETDEAAEAKLRSFAGQIAQNRFTDLGWDQLDGEPETNTKLRATLLGMMLYSQDPAMLTEAKERFESSDVKNLPAETRALLIGTYVKHHETEELLEELLDLYASTSSSDLKGDICAGLTSTTSPSTARRLLDLSKDSSVVKPQDAIRWFIYLIRNRHTRDTAWAWLTENWSWIEKTFSGDKSYDDYPRYGATGLTTKEQLTQYSDFFGPMKNILALSRAIALGEAEITARVELIERDQTAVIDELLAL